MPPEKPCPLPRTSTFASDEATSESTTFDSHVTRRSRSEPSNGASLVAPSPPHDRSLPPQQHIRTPKMSCADSSIGPTEAEGGACERAETRGSATTTRIIPSSSMPHPLVTHTEHRTRVTPIMSGGSLFSFDSESVHRPIPPLHSSGGFQLQPLPYTASFPTLSQLPQTSHSGSSFPLSATPAVAMLWPVAPALAHASSSSLASSSVTTPMHTAGIQSLGWATNPDGDGGAVAQELAPFTPLLTLVSGGLEESASSSFSTQGQHTAAPSSQCFLPTSRSFPFSASATATTTTEAANRCSTTSSPLQHCTPCAAAAKHMSHSASEQQTPALPCDRTGTGTPTAYPLYPAPYSAHRSLYTDPTGGRPAVVESSTAGVTIPPSSAPLSSPFGGIASGGGNIAASFTSTATPATSPLLLRSGVAWPISPVASVEDAGTTTTLEPHHSTNGGRSSSSSLQMVSLWTPQQLYHRHSNSAAVNGPPVISPVDVGASTSTAASRTGITSPLIRARVPWMFVPLHSVHSASTMSISSTSPPPNCKATPSTLTLSTEEPAHMSAITTPTAPDWCVSAINFRGHSMPHLVACEVADATETLMCAICLGTSAGDAEDEQDELASPKTPLPSALPPFLASPVSDSSTTSGSAAVVPSSPQPEDSLLAEQDSPPSLHAALEASALSTVMAPAPLPTSRSPSGGALMITLEVCRHSFHQSCLQSWLMQHTQCPLCRRPLTKNAPSGSGGEAV